MPLAAEPADLLVTRRPPLDETEDLVRGEWLVANGLGGFASCTISGVCTCRYHGLLVAAHPAPLGRAVMLTHVWVRTGSWTDICSLLIVDFRRRACPTAGRVCIVGHAPGGGATHPMAKPLVTA